MIIHSSRYSRNQSIYQYLKIADLYKILIANVKNLVPNVFDKEKYVTHYENLETLLKIRTEAKKIHHVLEFNQSQWLKQNVEFNTKKYRSRKG